MTEDYNRKEWAIEAWNHRPFESHAVEIVKDLLTEIKNIGFSYDHTGLSEDQIGTRAKQLLGLK